MTSIRIPQAWEIPERFVTPESVYMNRRRFLATLGIASGALWLAGCETAGAGGNSGATGRKLPDAASGGLELADFKGAAGFDLYPAKRSAAFAVDRPLTDETKAERYCNFYEFTSDKDVYRYVNDFEPYPWTVEVAGLCDNPRRWDLEALLRKFPLEERIYRHRCVEAWSMVVPWTGFPLAALLKESTPKNDARFVRFTGFERPEQAPGQKKYTWYKWPYYEGVEIGEAMNELAFFTVGVYGHPLTKPHGAPLRIVFPWKYGYKGPKGVVKIEFTSDQPHAFWNDLQPLEYGFHSNVNPSRPHPRWSQASERTLDTGERIPTRLYNGYEAQVAALYPQADPE